MATVIFHYTELSLFLRDAWLNKKKHNASFTLRAWARALGMASHAPLQLALEGKRGIPSRYIPKLIKSLELKGAERSYFQTLTDLSRAKSPQERAFHFERLEELSPRGLPGREELTELRFLSNPLDAVVAEMTALRGFKATAEWIQQRLRISATREQISESLARLKKLQVLRISPEGLCLEKSSRHFTTPPDFRHAAIQAFHREGMKISSEALAEVPIEEREYGAYALPVRTRDIPELKAHLRRAIADVIARFEAETHNAQGAEVHLLSLQFCPVTREKTKNP